MFKVILFSNDEELGDKMIKLISELDELIGNIIGSLYNESTNEFSIDLPDHGVYSISPVLSFTIYNSVTMAVLILNLKLIMRKMKISMS